MSKPWVQFVIAWNTKDAELAEAEDMLRGLLGAVLRSKLADGGRPTRQMASLGVPTIEEMSVVLPSLIHTAGRHFLRHQTPPFQSPPGTIRPPGGTSRGEHDQRPQGPDFQDPGER